MWAKLLATLLAVGVADYAIAQDSDAPEQRSLGELRADVTDATLALFEALNDAIDEPEFEIKCRRVAELGFRVGRRVCEPTYKATLERLATKRALSFAGFGGPATAPGAASGSVHVISNPDAQIGSEDQVFLDKMIVAVNTHPEAMAALVDLVQKQQALAAATASNRASED